VLKRSDSIEREYQFELPAGVGPDGFARALHEMGLRVGRVQRLEIEDAYLDTRHWHFLRAGVAVRVRTARGRGLLTVKALAPQRDGLAIRQEAEERLGAPPVRLDAIPRGKLGDKLRSEIGDQRVRVLFRISNCRRTWRVSCAGGARIEASLDMAVVVAGGRRRKLCEIELELVDGDPAALDEVARLVRERLGCQPSAMSKFERGLRLLGPRVPAS
jgi:adenylate cyclase